MLTIKQVTGTGEALYQGSEVMYHDGSNIAALQVMYLDGKEWKTLTDGLIYVMNEGGKTVASYSLAPANEAARSGPIGTGGVSLASGSLAAA